MTETSWTQNFGRSAKVGAAGVFCVALVASGLVVGGTSTAASTVVPRLRTHTEFSYVSEPGDPIGGGESATLKESRTTRIDVSGDLNRIRVGVVAPLEDFQMEFTPGEGRVFEPGTYRDAERVPFEHGRAPGVSVISGSIGCNEHWGSITIDQVSVDNEGNIDMLDLSFVQRCAAPADTPAFHGTILFNQLPLDFTLKRFTGTHLTPDSRHLWLNRDSVILAGGDTAEIGVNVSGHRVAWHLTLRAPVGQQFVPGTTYQTTRRGDATHAGLSLTGPDSCNESTGTLTITELIPGGGDYIDHLRLSFTYQCTGYQRHEAGKLRIRA